MKKMSNFNYERQELLKWRSWQETRFANVMNTNISTLVPFTSPSSNPINKSLYNPIFPGDGGGFFDDNMVSSVEPPLTVVFEGRSIGQRISLHELGSYQSLARALRQMFVDMATEDHHCHHNFIFPSSSSSHDNHQGKNEECDRDIDLSNAVPGHLIAYEDMENDLLLVGDLDWKDFVRVAKRIRILPAKPKSRKQKQEIN